MTDSNAKQRWAAWLKRQLDLRGWSAADLVDRGRGHFAKNAPYRWLNAENVPLPKTVMAVAEIFGVDPREAYEAAGYEHMMDVSGEIRVATDPAEAFVQQIRARGFPPVIEDRLVAEIRAEIERRRGRLEETLDTVEAAIDIQAEPAEEL